MDNEEIKRLLKELIPQLNKLTIDYMVQSGVRSSSSLLKSVEYTADSTGIQLVAGNYWWAYSEGRRPRTKKIPAQALIGWIKQRGIIPRNGITITQLAFAIQTAIYKRGLNPLGYADRVTQAATELTEEFLADEISVTLADEIVYTMTKTPYATEI